MAEISRDPADLAAQLIGAHHDYPDGAALYCGTMFAPVKDRDAPGKGFTHKPGDVVTVSADKLGALVNRMGTAGMRALGVRDRRADAQPGASRGALAAIDSRLGGSAQITISK